MPIIKYRIDPMNEKRITLNTSSKPEDIPISIGYYLFINP